MSQPTDEMLLFLAHSSELEQEAGERYTELADAMDAHNNPEVASFFRRMADEASNHLAEVSLFAAGNNLPDLQAWEYHWPDAEAPETASFESVHYRMSLRDAMLIALAQERSAHAFYKDYADRAEQDDLREVATSFADEELDHTAQLELLLQELPAVSEMDREDDDLPHSPD